MCKHRAYKRKIAVEHARTEKRGGVEGMYEREHEKQQQSISKHKVFGTRAEKDKRPHISAVRMPLAASACPMPSRANESF